MWSDMGNHGWWWGFGPLPMLLFWIPIIIGIVALGKWTFDRTGGAPRDKSALDILVDRTEARAAGQGWPVCGFKERYARGEIGKEEFEQKKRDLEGWIVPWPANP